MNKLKIYYSELTTWEHINSRNWLNTWLAENSQRLWSIELVSYEVEWCVQLVTCSLNVYFMSRALTQETYKNTTKYIANCRYGPPSRVRPCQFLTSATNGRSTINQAAEPLATCHFVTDSSCQ
jgi:hypothetical protein